MRIPILLPLLALLLPAASPAEPLAVHDWHVRPADPRPYAGRIPHGSAARLVAYLPAAPASATFHWQTNGMGRLWWEAPAECRSNAVSVLWTPAMDTGAAVHRAFFRISQPEGPDYSAFATLAMLDSPGFSPNALPMPVQTLDFAAVAWTNAPWALSSDIPPAPDLTPYATTGLVAEAIAAIPLPDIPTNFPASAITNAPWADASALGAYVATNHTGRVSIHGSFINGYGLAAIGEFSHVEGYKTTASAPYSHAEGYETTASAPYSHAEGYETTASGQGSHAEGSFTTASGPSSHADGYSTTASGQGSHAEGYQTTASGGSSHADGIKAVASHYTAFAWQGGANVFSVSTYESHGAGTFNINPVGGLGGFWIGETNLAGHLSSATNGLARLADATLNGRGLGDWTFSPSSLEGGVFSLSFYSDEDIGDNWFLKWTRQDEVYYEEIVGCTMDGADSTSLSIELGNYMSLPPPLEGHYGEMVTAVKAALPGYVLGAQTDKPLAGIADIPANWPASAITNAPWLVAETDSAALAAIAALPRQTWVFTLTNGVVVTNLVYTEPAP